MFPGRSLSLVHKATLPRAIGRYLMYDEIASGGMAAVHFGRFSSDAGFSRTVAIKYLHPTYAHDSEFISMFLDEARLVSRVRHPNVASPLDVVVVPQSQEIFLVMEYIHGETLAWLLDEAKSLPLAMPPNICASILSGALHGLHAAHEAVDEMGVPLNIVHRDISPQNIMVGADGVARVLDFGVAKAVSRAQSTRQGQVKGKVSYMSPEQLTSRPVDRRADIFAAGIVLWEALTMQRLFAADEPMGTIAKVLHAHIPRPSSINGNVSQALDRVTLKALQRNPSARFQDAREFASAIEEEAFVATTRKVAEWVSLAAGKSLADRAEKVWRIESDSLDAAAAQETQSSVQSMLTVSQTIAILRESELQDSGERDAPPVAALKTSSQGQPPRSEPTHSNVTVPDVMRAVASAPAQIASMPTSEPMANCDVTEIVHARVDWKRRLILGGMAVGLVLLAPRDRSPPPARPRPMRHRSWSQQHQPWCRYGPQSRFVRRRGRVPQRSHRSPSLPRSPRVSRNTRRSVAAQDRRSLARRPHRRIACLRFRSIPTASGGSNRSACEAWGWVEYTSTRRS
jgi:eukaryotic-like serine/threonine-protein kinase